MGMQELLIDQRHTASLLSLPTGDADCPAGDPSAGFNGHDLSVTLVAIAP